MNFGEFEVENNKATVEWHTSVKMGWPQAKHFCHFLRMNIAAFEAENGKIQIPKSVRPTPPSRLDEQQTNPTSEAVYQAINHHCRRSLQHVQPACRNAIARRHPCC